ncbi:hypothetical protein BACFRA24663_01020 [Bacteroides fragilis]|jgi:hypothetical protein|nr:MAG TPA: hypothetical protein [Caudoviricetes sp.]
MSAKSPNTWQGFEPTERLSGAPFHSHKCCDKNTKVKL